ncbi:MAG: hypothetical protein GY835_16890 [bacterium]|nr:hypothetical protein [bacterium]
MIPILSITLFIVSGLVGCRDNIHKQETDLLTDLAGTLSLGGSDWDYYYNASLSAIYENVQGCIDGGIGGTVQGSVNGYDTDFKIKVKPGAYSGSKTLTIMVPLGGEPVYQLLPHGIDFDLSVTVTLDYSHWLDTGRILEDESYRLLYMNEADGTFEVLTPPVSFIADPDEPTITFGTSHFSRWVIEDEGS